MREEMRGTRYKRLQDLAALRAATPPRKRATPPDEDFRRAMAALGVAPLPPSGRAHFPPAPRAPLALSRARDDAAVLTESVAEEIDVDTLLDTDEALSFRRPGIGPEVLRKLRRGHWVIQDEIDLHGHRVEQARAALADFLRAAGRRGMRCVRIVHGKGLGSKDRQPVLKHKVRLWLSQRDEVLAFCQARPAQGGAGALIVLLRAATAAR
ncbi:MAG: Smr/MutS family protein [Burkholderiaceae bacterium]|nr:Smr/MutS family protein [Burkholderiaceae bacterium]